jgi:hypothetical protein
MWNIQNIKSEPPNHFLPCIGPKTNSKIWIVHRDLGASHSPLAIWHHYDLEKGSLHVQDTHIKTQVLKGSMFGWIQVS